MEHLAQLVKSIVCREVAELYNWTSAAGIASDRTIVVAWRGRLWGEQSITWKGVKATELSSQSRLTSSGTTIQPNHSPSCRESLSDLKKTSCAANEVLNRHR